MGCAAGIARDLFDGEIADRTPLLNAGRLFEFKFFFADANRNSCYVLAGSFTGFLIRRYGVEAYRKFFRKTNASNFPDYFRKVFGVTFAKAEWQWHTELQTMAVLKRRRQALC